jgi:hypothetical protein
LALFGALFTLGVAYALGAIFFRSLPLPHVVRLGLGAAIESTLVFLLLLAGWASWPVFLAGGAVCLALLWRTKATAPPESPATRLVYWIFAPYVVLYAVYALAPETQPDAVSYHLGLVSEYVRLHRFPARIGFYEMIPQGLEMLFTVAFAFGRHVAAKLVHFAFLLATVPLIFATGRRLALPDRASIAAAALYFFTPVVGISGTCAYNDAALMFRDTGRDGYAAAAGIAAGFCFAIKFSAFLIPPLALLALLAFRRGLRPAWLLAAGAVVMIAPWVLRDLILTGNPVAPLMNAWFPNAYFNTVSETRLSQIMRGYEGFHWRAAFVDWAFRGNTQGVVGPLMFLLPIGLLALRKRSGRLLVLAGLLVSVPLAWNVGTRFLMPALPFLALAAASVIPGPAMIAAVVLQAVVCWPPVIRQIELPGMWTLGDFPWRAALRLDPETPYIENLCSECIGARLIETHTRPEDRVFGLYSVARAYTSRDTQEYWHSNRAEQLMDALILAWSKATLDVARCRWPEASFRAIRFVATGDSPREWRLLEARLKSGAGDVSTASGWSFSGGPDPWAASLAFDGNRTTAWRTREPQRRGMFLEVDFDRPLGLNGAELLMERNKSFPMIVVEGQEAGGKWIRLADEMMTQVAPRDDLRRDATRALKAAGFSYVLVVTETLGKEMLDHAADWGVVDAAAQGEIHLLRIL